MVGSEPFENDPAYESRIEQIFGETCPKYLLPGLRLIPQVEVKTRIGKFRIDFVIYFGKQRIAVECDGREFHNFDRDIDRDAAILKEGFVEVIYRLRGRDLYYHAEECLRAISLKDPLIFSQRGRIMLAKLQRLDLDIIGTLWEDIKLYCSLASIKRCPVDGCQGERHCLIVVTRRTLSTVNVTDTPLHIGGG